MCGLVGVFGNVSIDLEKAFNSLLQLDVIRGWDSTGVALVPTTAAHPAIIKGAVLPQELMSMKQYKDLSRRMMRMMLGHNRAATRGTIENRNAHPFMHGDITLAHNGTLNSVFNLPEGNKFGTDSEAICHAFATIGVAETWKKLNGAATLVWWDADDRSINFATNGKRSFWFSYTESRDAIIWASETWMIDAVAARHNIKLEEDENGNYLWRPWNDYHLNFQYDPTTRTVDEQTEKLEAYSPPPIKVTYQTKQTQAVGPLFNWKDKSAQKYRSTKKDKKRKENLHHKTMTLLQFREKYKNCMFCAETLWNEYDEAVIIDEEEAVCGSCSQAAGDIGLDLFK